METVYILNIPNFYSSYYLSGLNSAFNIKFEMDPRFLKYNNRSVLIFKMKNKIGVIDNDDPAKVITELYELSTCYFATNKLIESDSYNQEKVEPLFPHYPINNIKLYLGLYNFKLLKYLPWKPLLKQIYTLLRRPVYKKYKYKVNSNNFMFFSSNIWKKESEANLIRADFIRFCKSDKRVDFEGGFVPRSDNDNQGFDQELNSKKYTPKLFSKLSAKSKMVLNNPAVGGAVSWRLAEYLNQGVFILSFPFKIELPIALLHDKDLYYVNDSSDYSVVFDKVFSDNKYHEKISKEGKAYFDKYCTPINQAKYIAEKMLN